MKRILSCTISLLCAGLCVYGAHAVSVAGPRPSVYATLSRDRTTRELSLVIKNIGGSPVAIPAGGFDIFVRPSPFDATLATLHIRPSATRTAEAVPLEPGQSTRIRGLERFAADPPSGRNRLCAVFEATAEAPGAWRGMVRTFPVNLDGLE